MAMIKKGTYRFNSLLDSCGYTKGFTENIEFYNTLVYTVNEEDLPDIKEEWGIEISAGVYKFKRKCRGIKLSFTADNRYRNWVNYLNSNLVSADPYVEAFEIFFGKVQDVDIVYDSYAYPYDYYTEVDGTEYWGNEQEQGGNIITITQDQDVTDEFYTWFIVNSKPVIKAGTYRFNDVLTQSVGGCIFDGFFTATSVLNIPPISEYGFGGYVGEHTFECTRIYQEYDTPFVGSISYRVVSVHPELPQSVVDLGVALPFEPYVYDGQNDSWDTWYGRGFQTITITEDTEVLDEFYNWFTENTARFARLYPSDVVYSNGERCFKKLNKSQ
jgi:hypothetical protein